MNECCIGSARRVTWPCHGAINGPTATSGECLTHYVHTFQH